MGAWAGCWLLGFLSFFAVTGFNQLTGWNDARGGLELVGWLAMGAGALLLGGFYYLVIDEFLKGQIRRHRGIWEYEKAEQAKPKEPDSPW
jgi:hypothetical protein